MNEFTNMFKWCIIGLGIIFSFVCVLVISCEIYESGRQDKLIEACINHPNLGFCNDIGKSFMSK